VKQFRPASVVFAGLLALALSGCSGTTPEPSESPSPTSAAPTSSAPASPTPKPATSTSPAENLEPPEMPELATEFSADGFEAFVEYWFEAHNYAMATGDVDPMMAVSSERCGFCMSHEKGFNEIYEDGGWIREADQTPHDFATNMEKLGGGAYHAYFTLHQAAGEAYSSDGDVRDDFTFTRDEHDYEFFAFYDEETGWSAALIDLEESGE